VVDVGTVVVDVGTVVVDVGTVVVDVGTVVVVVVVGATEPTFQLKLVELTQFVIVIGVTQKRSV